MKISVIGWTCETQKDAMLFAGHAAGVCYMPKDFNALLGESEGKTLARSVNTLTSGHHSVYDHITYNLLLEDIPKILAIVLNNEGCYTTSEKSARYTKMQMDGVGAEYYTKWLARFIELIEKKYGEKFEQFYRDPKKAQKAIEKLAMENARYLISVFTPTTMIYTVSLRQLNYILGFFAKYIRDTHKGDFETKLANTMVEFCNAVPEELKFPALNADAKGREISLFRKISGSNEYFEDIYSTSYLGSWAMFAQAQRHRTLHYQIALDDSCKLNGKQMFYIPTILAHNQDWGREWADDLVSIQDTYPQAQLIRIYECGTYQNFLLKCYERLCGCAQLEITHQTWRTLNRYHDSRPDLITDDFMRGARCTFPHFKCNNVCVWRGGWNALTREI